MTPDADADYSYAEPAPAYAPSSPSIQLPFALLACAMAMIMIIQTQGAFRQKSALQEGKTQLIDTVSKREPAIKQVAEIKSKANAMIIDLLILGKTDEDAKAIIAKYNIQQNGSAPTEAAPAGDPPK